MENDDDVLAELRAIRTLLSWIFGLFTVFFFIYLDHNQLFFWQ